MLPQISGANAVVRMVAVRLGMAGLLCMVFLIAEWDFLVIPTLTGSLILVAMALVYNHLGKGRRYPTYWL